MKTRSILLYLLMAVQVVGLGSLYTYHAIGRDAPRRFRFEAGPVDPRDVFRGDYIVLGYPALERFPGSEEAIQQAGDGERYVTLRRDGAYWRADQLLTTPPTEGEPFLRAQLHSGRLDYGLGRYYVPEGKGRPPGKIVVEVAVRPDGSAQIRQLFSDGQPWP